MADLLKALQQSYYTPQETEYGIAADIIGKSTPAFYNPYASTGQNLATGIGGALVSGLLGGMARGSAAKRNAEMLPQIQQIFQAPASQRMQIVGDNQRLSPLVAAMQAQEFKQQQDLANFIEQETNKQLIQKLADENKLLIGGKLQDVSKFGIPSIYEREAKLIKAKKGAEYDAEAKRVEGEQRFDEITEDANALLKRTPRRKIDAALAKEYEEQTRKEVTQLPIYKDLAKMETSFKQLVSLVQDDSKASDIGIIAAMAKIWDPQGVINENEFRVNAEAQSALDNIFGNTRAFIKAKSRLSKKTKGDMVRAAAAKYNAFGETYERSVNNLLNILEKRGGDPGMVARDKFRYYKPSSKQVQKYEVTSDGWRYDPATKKILGRDK